MKRRTRYSIILVVMVILAGGFALLLYLQATSGIATPNSQKGSPTSSFATSGTLATTARYTVNSSPTGQWLVVQADSPISSVSASDTGTISAYSSLASLNQTSIGYECSQKASDGACSSFEYVQQTGWFWDSASRTLTVHYLGGANVVLTLVEQP
jgi:hypothetical protein